MQYIPLTAGPLTMSFDTETAFLRQICIGGDEIVRAVFAAVRDQNWDTIPFAIHDLSLEQHESSFAITFRAECQHPTIGFAWDGLVTGTASGQVRYVFRGQAHSTFLRNRIGLCVLHPIHECAGADCVVEHVDGSTSRGTFPHWISAHQPFRQMRSISHATPHGHDVRVRMDGDIFEMEDQRNWSDASYKIYSTPLDLPFPVQVNQGTMIEQSVQIEVDVNQDAGTQSDPRLAAAAASRPRRHAQATDNDVAVEVDWGQATQRPPIGFLYADVSEHSAEVIQRLATLCPDHLRVDVRLDEPTWPGSLLAATELCRQIGASLEIAVFTASPDSESWNQMQQIVADCHVRLARCLLFHPAAKVTPNELARAVTTQWLERFPAAPLVVGTDAYFAELNRNAPERLPGGRVCFSSNPQVHAFDNWSLRETLEALPSMIDSAHQLTGGRVVLSPITLRPRFNPNATEGSLSRHEQLRGAIDPRQQSGFGAAWTAGVLSALLNHPQLDSLTLFESHGPRGVVGEHGERFPMTELFELVLPSACMFTTTSSMPLHVRALACKSVDDQARVILANLSDQPRCVTVVDPNGNVRRQQVEAESIAVWTDAESAA